MKQHTILPINTPSLLLPFFLPSFSPFWGDCACPRKEDKEELSEEDKDNKGDDDNKEENDEVGMDKEGDQNDDEEDKNKHDKDE